MNLRSKCTVSVSLFGTQDPFLLITSVYLTTPRVGKDFHRVTTFSKHESGWPYICERSCSFRKLSSCPGVLIWFDRDFLSIQSVWSHFEILFVLSYFVDYRVHWIDGWVYFKLGEISFFCLKCVTCCVFSNTDRRLVCKDLRFFVLLYWVFVPFEMGYLYVVLYWLFNFNCLFLNF